MSAWVREDAELALLSQLFRNDPQLEAAAISDAAHIVPGAKGEHVRKIQIALIQLDRAFAAADGVYGPVTAAAVLAYKRRRDIVNRAYQTEADNIVGRMTIDRLDKEMLAAEPRIIEQTPRCVFPPEIRPSTRLSFAGGSEGAGLAPGALTGFMLLAEKDASLPRAKSWIASTLAKLDIMILKVAVNKVHSAEDLVFFSSIETHFKIGIPGVTQAVAADRLRRVREMYLKIQKVLDAIGPGSPRVMGNPGVPDKALGPLGGFDIPGQFITIGADFHNSNDNMRAAVLIHEGGHFADASCSHAASEQPAPEGAPIEDSFGTKVNPGKLKYSQLNFDLHMQNAYSFAQCAMHHGLGFDKRPP